MNRILLLLAFCFFSLTTQAQIGIQVVVDSGMATSDCTDPFGGAPDPLFAVAAEGGTYNYYPAVGACFNTLPDTIYQANFPCLSAVPMTVEICLLVTENDALFQPPLGCDITESCTETICDNFVVPMVGNTANYNLAINAPGSSSGSVNFSIQTDGFAFPDNDLPTSVRPILERSTHRVWAIISPTRPGYGLSSTQGLTPAACLWYKG